MLLGVCASHPTKPPSYLALAHQIYHYGNRIRTQGEGGGSNKSLARCSQVSGFRCQLPGARSIITNRTRRRWWQAKVSPGAARFPDTGWQCKIFHPCNPPLLTHKLCLLILQNTTIHCNTLHNDTETYNSVKYCNMYITAPACQTLHSSTRHCKCFYISFLCILFLYIIFLYILFLYIIFPNVIFLYTPSVLDEIGKFQ